LPLQIKGMHRQEQFIKILSMVN